MKDDKTPDTKQRIRNEYVGKDKNEITRSENADPSYVPDTAHFEKRDTESPLQYKAFLLYAMQASKKRSFRRVAEAVGKSDFWARKLSKDHDWTTRINKEKSQADRRAFKAYCSRCVSEMTQEELGSVGRNMRFDPLAAFAKRAPEASAVFKKRIVPEEQHTPAAVAVAEAIVEQQVSVDKSKEADAREQAMDNQKKIVQAVIGRAVEGLKDGSMRISPKDLQNFMTMQQDLLGFAMDKDGEVRGVESVRVKFAREQGDDLLVAMRKDLQDMNTIMQSLWDKREQAKIHDAEVEAERQRLMAEMANEQ